MKLRAHLGLLILGTLLPMVAFSAAMLVWMHRQTRAATERGLLDTARAVAVAVDREHSGTIAALKVLATSEHLRSGNLTAFHRVAREAVATQPTWQNVVLYTPSARPLVNTLLPIGAPVPAVANREPVERAVRTRVAAVSDLFVGRLTNRPLISIVIPVDEGGTPRYALGAVVTGEALSELIQQQQLPPDWLITLTDRTGTIIARTREGDQSVGHPAGRDLIAAITARPEGSFQGETKDGMRVYAAFSRSAVSGWRVAIAAPVSIVDAPLRNQLMWLVIVGAFFALLGTVIAGMIGRRMAQPILSLSAAAAQLAKGEPFATPQKTSVAEVNTVMQAMEAASRERLGIEARTAATLEASLDSIVTIDHRGQITEFNPAAERTFGYRRVEVLGREMAALLIPPALRDQHREGLARYLATGHGPVIGQRLEMTALRADGTEFPIELAITRLPSDGPPMFTGFIRDIAHQKRAQEALRESEASFRLLFSSNPHSMWVYDVATLYFLEVNDAAVAHYGYSRDEFLSMRLSDIRPPEDVPQLEEVVKSLAEGAVQGVRRHEGRWRHRLKDGRVRDVDIVSHAIDFAGRRAVLVVAIDVTELTQTQGALARYVERLDILHEIDRAIVAAKAPVEVAETVLRRLRELLGVPRAIVNLFDFATGEAEWLAAAGRHRIHLGPGVRFPLALMGDVDALRRGELQVIDVASLPRSPEAEALLASDVHVYMVVPMIAGGELIGALSFGGATGQFPPEQVSIAREAAAQLAVAITQTRLYERVKQHAAELEQRVEERTLALRAANEQLQQEIAERRRAEEEADRANRAKSDFLSRMSHELRTPLNGILGFAQLLEMESLPADQEESVTHILKAGRHLLGLINEVLDISRIEAGRLQLSLEPVPVGETLRGAVDLVRPLAAQRDIALVAEVADDHRHVLADRQRLQQVLLNLLSNAVKYNRTRGAVAVSCEERSGGRLRMLVTDTGHGISPDKIERLFTPFDRLGAEGAGIEGTGLGLALSKHLVEVMGGTLDVTSQVGVGSTFAVEFPLTTAPADALKLPAASPTVQAERGEGRMVVLYIEDNVSNLRLVEQVLGRRPQTTLLSAMQGQLGLDLAREHRPDLILLDLHLPDVPGDEVLRRLREEPQTRGIPVVILSADATPGQVERLLAAGAQAYLTKPLDVRQLLALVDQRMSQKRG
jgi:PAS domain S-box-containing protein